MSAHSVTERRFSYKLDAKACHEELPDMTIVLLSQIPLFYQNNSTYRDKIYQQLTGLTKKINTAVFKC